MAVIAGWAHIKTIASSSPVVEERLPPLALRPSSGCIEGCAVAAGNKLLVAGFGADSSQQAIKLNNSPLSAQLRCSTPGTTWRSCRPATC